MADKPINSLPQATDIADNDSFVLEQNAAAKRLTGKTLLEVLLRKLDGHGGITSFVLVSSSGLEDAYRITFSDGSYKDIKVRNGRGITGIAKTAANGNVDTYTISYNDGTTSTFTVRNGSDGKDGKNAYVWIRYASQMPSDSNNSIGASPDRWIGIYSGSESSAPTEWSAYEWYDMKGERGVAIYRVNGTNKPLERYSYSDLIMPYGYKPMVKDLVVTTDGYLCYVSQVFDDAELVDITSTDISINGKNAYQYAVEAGYEGTEEEFASELLESNFIVDLAEDGSGGYTANKTYMEIAQARASDKLVLLRYGAYITHILAGEPTEDSFLFEPLLHSVEGMPGYIVDINDNWSVITVAEHGYETVIYGVSDGDAVRSAAMSGKPVYCLLEDLYYLPMMECREDANVAYFGGAYNNMIITCEFSYGGWFVKTEKIGTGLSAQITKVVDQNSTDAQIPTAKAVYEFGKNFPQNIKPVEKTENMTQPVGVDENGGLFTAPGASGTVLVAANDAPDIIKAAAQYVCTGVNDQLTINAAIRKVGKGEVRLSGGNYDITGDIIPLSDIVVFGQNAILNVCDEISSIITQAYTGGDTVIHVADASVFVLGQKVSTDAGIATKYDCHIVAIDPDNGTVTLDKTLNSTNGFDANTYRLIADFPVFYCQGVANVVIEGVTINGNKESYGFYDTTYGSNGIMFREASQCKAIRCTVNKARGHGILTTMSAQCQVLNCIVDDCGNLGIDVFGGDGGHLVHGCVAKNCDNIGFQGHNAVNTIFSNCIAVNCLEGISAQEAPDNVVITGCEVYDSIQCGIKCVAKRGKMVSIVGNTIIGGLLDGIQIDASSNASDFVVSNNVIKNSASNAINVIGIHGFSIIGNHIVNPLATDSAAAITNNAAIKMSGTASKGYVANNHILLNTTETTGCPCGIAEYNLTGDYNIVAGNVIRGARIAATQKLGANSKFENNYEF